MEPRIRRIRISPIVGPSLPRRDMSGLKDRVEAIQRLQNEIDCKSAEAEDLKAALATDMKKYGLTTLEAATSVAKVITPTGRSQTKISVAKLRAVLTDDKEYNDCLDVSVTRVKKYLGEKEILSIATIIPAAAGKPVLKVLPRKGK